MVQDSDGGCPHHRRWLDTDNDLTTRRDAAQTALIEARKPFLDKRLELYMVAASAAATVASLHATPAEVEAAKDRFRNLYYGPLAPWSKMCQLSRQ
jgi:hypothetical protein